MGSDKQFNNPGDINQPEVKAILQGDKGQQGLEKALQEQVGPRQSTAEREAVFDQKVRDLIISGDLDAGAYKLDFKEWVNPRNLHALGHAVIEGDQAAIDRIKSSIKDPQELQRTLDTMKKLGMPVPDASTPKPVDTSSRQPQPTDSSTANPIPGQPTDTGTPKPIPKPEPHPNQQPADTTVPRATFNPVPNQQPVDTTTPKTPTPEPHPNQPADTTVSRTSFSPVPNQPPDTPTRTSNEMPPFAPSIHPAPDQRAREQQMQNMRRGHMQQEGHDAPPGSQFTVEGRADGSFTTKDTQGRITGIYYPDGKSSRTFHYGDKPQTANTVMSYDITTTDDKGQQHNKHLSSRNGYDWSDGSKGVACPGSDGTYAFVNCDKAHPGITAFDSSGQPTHLTADQAKNIFSPMIQNNFKFMKLHHSRHTDLRDAAAPDTIQHIEDLVDIQKDQRAPGPQRLVAAMLHTFMQHRNADGIFAGINRDIIGNKDPHIDRVAPYAIDHMDEVVDGM